MFFKKEWQLFLLLMVIYYLDYIIDIEMDGWDVSTIPMKDMVFVAFSRDIVLDSESGIN